MELRGSAGETGGLAPDAEGFEAVLAGGESGAATAGGGDVDLVHRTFGLA